MVSRRLSEGSSGTEASIGKEPRDEWRKRMGEATASPLLKRPVGQATFNESRDRQHRVGSVCNFDSSLLLPSPRDFKLRSRFIKSMVNRVLWNLTQFPQ